MHACYLVGRQPARWVLDLLDNNSDHHFHRHRPEVVDAVGVMDESKG